ncbi:NAD(P)-dependent oxidoreductase [Picrophilus oshimae]|uniref:2-hydroxy-3-oxopropionate reductase n=1 Tax=Picrophilus torridus (strain ATCC 700027 / DSM 9790 / JCM 10055 / NBRC 100828 / KAW 2/3) TaxID=1122961 RepID=Q6KZX0_PICTO|nr:NAD(P)-binding domain-containing protein [Picrophilus oshimae]AAT43732.1 2-hydroxy-3-oxopropionate reductase [Picrophilus oshimae DSM 9789]
MNVGVLGLGRMGSGMAYTLLKKNFNVTGYDVNKMAYGRFNGIKNFKPAESIDDLYNNDAVIFSLPTGLEVKQALSSYNNKSIIIDTTTLDIRELHENLAIINNSKNYLTCRLERGPKEANEGDLAMFVGGDMETYNKINNLFDALGTHVFIGTHEQATMMKLISNMIGTAIVDLLGQVSVVIERAGIDKDTAIKALSLGGANTVELFRLPWQISSKYEPSFSLELAQHVIEMAINSSRELGIEEIPMVQLNNTMMKLGLKMNLGSKDVSEIAELYKKLNK